MKQKKYALKTACLYLTGIMSREKKFLVGCSGYYYPNWKNKFYPPKLPSSKWLEFYSSVFNTVELNGTFYRVPKLTDLKRQSDNTPDDFRFSVKMNRYITHVLRLKNTNDRIRDFTALVNEGFEKKLHKILLQMPPSFHFNEENLMLLEDAEIGEQNVIEFRHPSWWNDKTLKVLKKKKCTFCNVDFPGMETSFLHSTKDFYLRLHGNPVLFKSSYDDETLKEFFGMIPEKMKSCSVYFNNTYFSGGYENAGYFRELTQQK
ncbi:MAG: DUF72 domain-containing protein [Bacteroidia bacterium]